VEKSSHFFSASFLSVCPPTDFVRFPPIQLLLLHSQAADTRPSQKFSTPISLVDSLSLRQTASKLLLFHKTLVSLSGYAVVVDPESPPPPPNGPAPSFPEQPQSMQYVYLPWSVLSQDSATQSLPRNERSVSAPPRRGLCPSRRRRRFPALGLSYGT